MAMTCFTVHAADSVCHLTTAVTTTDTAMRARMKKDVASIIVDYYYPVYCELRHFVINVVRNIKLTNNYIVQTIM
jgi:hypothetical protein